MEKDQDGTTSGQQVITKAGTTALALSGSDADLVLSGTMAQIIFSGTSGTLNMSGPTPAIVGAIQHRNTKAGTVAIDLSGSDADIQLTGTNSQIILSGNASKITFSGTSQVLDMAGETPAITGAIQLRVSKAGTVAVDLSGSDSDIQLTGSNAQIIMSGDTPTLNMSGAGGLLTGTMQVVTNRAGTVAINVPGSDADIQLTGTNSQIILSGNASKITMSGTNQVLDMTGEAPSIAGAILLNTSKAGTTAVLLSGSDADLEITGTNAQILMSGNASGIRLTGTSSKWYMTNDVGQVGTIDFTGSSIRLYFGGGTGTFV
jgi:diaminopimelate epimerase